MSEQIHGKCKLLSEWSDWDPAIHDREDQIDRQRRSQTYPFLFDIVHGEKMGIFSSTSDLPYYETTLSHCTCYDFQYRKLPCKHIYRLAQELGIIEIIDLHDNIERQNVIRSKRTASERKRLDEIKSNLDLDALDSEPEQQKRIKDSEKCTIISIDCVTQTAVFQGSSKKPYETTVDSCTCRDYFVRRLPCKHIYRLRAELSKMTDTQEE